MFHIDEEMTRKLDNLDILIQRRLSRTTDGCRTFTSNAIVNDCRRSHDAKKQMMPATQGNDTARRQQKTRRRADQEIQCEEPTLCNTKKTNGIDTYVGMNKLSPTGSRWPPVDKHDLCNFGPR